jgi:hypothetical protein
MKSIFKTSFILLLLVLLSCGASVKRAKPGANADPRTLSEAEFNILDDQSDEEVVTSDVPQAHDDNGAAALPAFPQKPTAPGQSDLYFSVQVFASKSSTEARDFKDSISSQFKEEIRIDYQAPYYKVCIGKIADFDDAQELLKKVNGMGFPQAWLVRLRK